LCSQRALTEQETRSLARLSAALVQNTETETKSEGARNTPSSPRPTSPFNVNNHRRITCEHTSEVDSCQYQLHDILYSVISPLLQVNLNPPGESLTVDDKGRCTYLASASSTRLSAESSIEADLTSLYVFQLLQSALRPPTSSPPNLLPPHSSASY
jgi:hypothetical protein